MAGVYVKGMEMPEKCEDCRFWDGQKNGCPIVFMITLRRKRQEKPDWCPLVEIPDHGGLVDKKKLVEALGLLYAVKYGNKDAEQQRNSYETLMRYEIADILDDAEIVIPADKEEA